MIPFEEWAAINQVEARRRARDPELKPLHYRVEYAAMGWANLIGHAEFAPGGLALVLQVNNPKTGELAIPSKTRVSNAIKEARDRGLIDEISTALCLVAPAEWLAKQGGHGGKTCKFHGIRARRPFTSPVNPDLSKFTSPVNPVHVSREPLSVKRPISDLFSSPPANEPQPERPDSTERHAS